MKSVSTPVNINPTKKSVIFVKGFDEENLKPVDVIPVQQENIISPVSK